MAETKAVTDLGLYVESVDGEDYRNCDPFVVGLLRLLVGGLYLKGISWGDITLLHAKPTGVEFEVEGRRVFLGATKPEA